MFLDRFKKYDFPLLGYIKMPKISVDEKQRKRLKLNDNPSPDDYLKALVNEGLNEKTRLGKIPESKYQEYKTRTEEELKIICDLGFASYILLVYEILRYCRENNILNSPSRGSVGGSLCCYLIKITKIDPIKHGLLFSRFLSSDRTEKKEINGDIYIKSDCLPDIDLDSEHRGKPLVKAKIEEMYPKRTVAISNVSTLSSKILIKEVLKIYYEYSETEAKNVSDMIEKSFGKVASIKKSMENNKQFQKWAEDKKEIVDICCKLQDMTRHKSVHAAGVLLCEQPVQEIIPVEYDKDGHQVCAYDMESAQMLGIKVDNLAVITLDICHDCLSLVGKTIDYFDEIDVDDFSIYNYLCSNQHYYGLFQVSEGVGKQTLVKIKPQNIDNIIDSIAIGRPGSLAFIDTYVQNSADLSKIDPRVRDLLIETRGIIIYQETIMKLAMKMANFTPQEADKLRKGIGKKKKEIVLSMKEKFINGAVKNLYNIEFINWCWSTFEASADYSFNKCLSPDTVVEAESGYKMMFEVQKGEKIKAYNIQNKCDHFTEVIDIYENQIELYEVEMEDGRKIKASLDHKFLCKDFTMRTLREIIINNLEVVTD
jgi:DNA polymerase III subunit alpha